MVDLLDNYEHEFQELTFAVSQRVSKIPNLTGSPKTAEIEAAEGELEEAERVLNSMNLRLKSGSTAEPVVNRVKGFGEDLKKLRKDLKKARTTFGDADRQRLLGTGEEVSLKNLDDRSRLLHDIEEAQGTSDVIRDMHRNAREGLSIGTQTLNELEQQNQLMDQMRDRLRGVNEVLEQSRRIMNVMWRRMVENKIIVGVIIVLLVLMIAFVIWVKWF